jgi:hypothetical protein
MQRTLCMVVRLSRSIYFRDPNGYVVELTAKTPDHDREMDPATNAAREKLDRWQAEKLNTGISGA